MRQKRFSLFQLLLAAALTAAVVLAAGALAVNYLLGGAGGRSLVEAWHLINTRFVEEYDQEAVIDGALEGMVNALGDRWSYTLTADELSAQNQRRTNQYVGIGITVNYANEEGLEILEVAAGGPAEEAGLLPGAWRPAVSGCPPRYSRPPDCPDEKTARLPEGGRRRVSHWARTLSSTPAAAGRSGRCQR